MSDTDGKKTLGIRGPGAGRPGQVKQSFSHGRTKNVVVETKRKRVVVPKPGAPAGKSGGPSGGGDPSRRPAGISDAEMERRMKALAAAKAREAEEAAKRAADEKARAEERERRRAEIEAKEAEEREREERAKAKAEEEARKLEAEAAAKAAAEQAKAAPAASAPAAPRGPDAKPATAPKKIDRERENRDRAAKPKGQFDGRRSGKLNLRFSTVKAARAKVS